MFYRVPVLLVLALFIARKSVAKNSCTYSTWAWSTIEKKAMNHQNIIKPRSQLTHFERDKKSPCTICKEDQEWIHIEGIPPFQICRHFAERVREVLLASLKQGFPIYEVIGYRVGKSKGSIDKKGLRTVYSHHSFGTAIDINPKSNGLYENCLAFSPKCRLLRGGHWKNINPASIKKESIIYHEFRNMGWLWGGEIKGQQKDFMHFSATGD